MLNEKVLSPKGVLHGHNLNKEEAAALKPPKNLQTMTELVREEDPLV